jgi:hypothetical protein
MNKQAKRIQRIRQIPSDYTLREMIALLSGFGLSQNNKGKTSGSRVVFEDNAGHHVFFHLPHPGRVFDRNVVRNVIDQLEKQGFI